MRYIGSSALLTASVALSPNKVGGSNGFQEDTQYPKAEKNRKHHNN
jgi:hypothetical protein